MKKNRTARAKKSQSCKGKWKYTEEQARETLAFRRFHGDFNLDMYHCRFCDWHHLGHDNRKNWKNINDH